MLILCAKQERDTGLKSNSLGDPHPPKARLNEGEMCAVSCQKVQLSGEMPTEFSRSHLKHEAQNDQNYVVRWSLKAGQLQRGMRTQENAIIYMQLWWI